MSRLKIMLVDSQALFRQGLAALLSRHEELQVIAQAADGENALAAMARQAPDLVIIDPEIPRLNGIDTLLRARQRYPTVRFLCLSPHSEQYRVNAALDAGAAGYLLKDCEFEECITAILKVARGQVYLSPEIATAMALSQRSAGSTCANPALSHRERQVLQLLAEGLSTRDIAERLHISGKTVSTHREHIMNKLNLKGIAQLTRYAVRQGWLGR